MGKETTAAAMQPIGFMYFIAMLKNQRSDLTTSREVLEYSAL